MSGNKEVRAFSIAGRIVNMRERLAGMTDDERRWRAQWLKDQELAPEEPRFVPEYYKATTNIFRRIWRFPGRQYEALLRPFLGKEKAHRYRLYTATTIYVISAAYIIGYLLKYHSNEFSRYRSIEVHRVRNIQYPDEANYPNFEKKTPQDYYDFGFYSSPLAK